MKIIPLLQCSKQPARRVPELYKFPDIKEDFFLRVIHARFGPGLALKSSPWTDKTKLLFVAFDSGYTAHVFGVACELEKEDQ